MLVKEIYSECVNNTFCLGVEQLNIVEKVFSVDWLYLCVNDNGFVMEDLSMRPDEFCSGQVLPIYYDNDLAEEESYRCRTGIRNNDVTVVGFRPNELIHEILKLGIDFIKVYYKYYNVVIDAAVFLRSF